MKIGLNGSMKRINLTNCSYISQKSKVFSTACTKTILGQRISPPSKPKVQIQICLLNEDQATFVFMNAKYNHEQMLEERDLVQRTLQQALIHHRQILNQIAQKAAKDGSGKEQKAKIKILEQNAHLHQLYLHLVKEKLITAQDFWSLHYKSDEKAADVDEQQRNVPISSGFLSSIVQSEGIAGGIKLNLTSETIHSIFRTYPAVERKHLELVPHEMSEQEFWSRFFQSHYFHRERNPIEPSTSKASQPQNDTFADCVQMDEKDMRNIVEKEQRRMKRHLDLTYINEDLGILSDMRSSQISVRGSTEAKRLLVRRCNYHSERVLSTMDEEQTDNSFTMTAKNSNGLTLQNGTHKVIASNDKIVDSTDTTVSASHKSTATTETPAILENALTFESNELAELDEPSGDFSPLLLYNPQRQENQRKSPGEIERIKMALKNSFDSSGSVLEEKNQIAFFDNLTTNFTDDHDDTMDSNKLGEKVTAIPNNFQELNKIDVERIRTVHACLAELLRHFWQCFPPKTPEIEQKIFRMDETLTKFEQTQLMQCEKQYGSVYVEHCKDMLRLARQRFQAFAKTNANLVQQQKR